MKYIVDISEIAEGDLSDSITWYQKKREGLGNEFLEEVNRSIKLIKKHPHGFSAFFENYRCCSLNKFPFKIIFSTEGRKIRIWAIYHHKRNPGKWMRRDY